MYSRRAQGRRSLSEEIDGLSVSRPSPKFPPRGRETRATREEGEGNPFGGADSAFQHGATEMGIGKKYYQHRRHLGPLFAYEPVHGRGGGGRLGTTWVCEEKKMEKRTIVPFLVSPLSQYTCVCPPEPSVVLLQRRDAGLSTVCALRHIASLSRGRQATKRGRASLPSACAVVVPERTSWSFRYSRLAKGQTRRPMLSWWAGAGRMMAIRRRRRQFERTALHKLTDVPTTISTCRR